MTSADAKDIPDAESADTAYERLQAINGYPEIFSVFAGETVTVPVARKPGANPQTGAVNARDGIPIRKIEFRDTATGGVVSSTRPTAARIFEEAPAGYGMLGPITVAALPSIPASCPRRSTNA